MHDIDRALSTASRRLFLNAFFRAAVVMATFAAAVLLVLVAIEKLSPVAFDWNPILIAAGGVTLVTAAIAAHVRRPKGVALADELDRRAGLRETLSTAIALKGNTDAWAVAVKESAAERANRIVMRDAVPVTAPRRWQAPALMLAVAGVAYWLAPTHDLTGLLDRQAAEDEQQAEIRTVALEIKAREDELREVLDRAGVEMEEDETAEDGADQDKPTSPEELRRASLKKLTKLSDTLKEKMNGEQAQQAKALQENIERLKTPGPGPMTEFARAMARGEFSKAQAALDEFNKDLQEGEVSTEEAARAAEQLKSLAEQMEQLAKDKEALKNELEKQGMDSETAEKLANDPNALKEAVEQMQNMSPEQKQALMNNMMGQIQSSMALQSMAQSMSQLSQQMQSACQNPGGKDGKMSQGQCQGMQAGMSKMGEQLSASEMASAEMQALQAAMSQCQSQMAACGSGMCENPGSGNGNGSGKGQQMARGNGGGQGGGIGSADVTNEFDAPLAAADDYMLKAEKTSVANNGGPIIGSTMVYGSQVRGEATAQFGEAVGASAVQAAEAIETMRVPREYHDAVRAYFGRLEKIASEGEAAKPEAGTN